MVECRRKVSNRLLFMQEDGNLVLYTSDRRVAWASNTDSGSTDAYTLEVKSLCTKLEPEHLL